MINKLRFEILAFGIPLIIILFLAFLSRTALFLNSPEQLSLGILADLLITIPLVYFLLIRNTKIPKFSTFYLFLIGIALAGFLIPLEQQALLSNIKYYFLPILELSLVSLFVYKVVSLNKSFKKNKENKNDFYDNLLVATNDIMPNRLGKVLATEIAVFYYLFSFGKKREAKELEFTYFKKSGIYAVLGVLLVVILLETFVVHLLIGLWSTTVAWICTALGLYAAVQIIAVLKSMSRRLIRVDAKSKSLNLRYGFGCQTNFSIDEIDRIEKGKKASSKDGKNISLSLFDVVDSHNLTIYLKSEQTLYKFYGIEKQFQSISIFIDEQDSFINTIERLRSK